MSKLTPQEFIGPLSSEQMADQKFQSDLLINKITKATNGNTKTARELLNMAACQLLKTRTIEPNLLEHICTVLINVANNPAEQAAKKLLIAETKPANRPVNETRNKIIFTCWQAACEFPALVDPEDDESYIRKEALRINNISDKTSRDKAIELWNDAHAKSLTKRNKTDKSTYELAAKLFNSNLKEAKKNGFRMEENCIQWNGVKTAVNQMFRKSKSNET